MIQWCCDMFPIQLMYQCLRVSPNGCYGRASGRPSGQARESARITGADLLAAYGPGRGCRQQSVHVGRPALCGRAMWSSPSGAPDAPGRPQDVPQRRSWRKKTVKPLPHYDSESSGSRRPCDLPPLVRPPSQLVMHIPVGM